MPRTRTYAPWVFLLLLAGAVAFLWSVVFSLQAHAGKLMLHVLDVGQGDALLIEAPNGTQVLIDGGPDAGVLAELGRILPFWDRSIDLVILTHPHADHVTGLIDVLKRYRVGMVLESEVNYPTAEYAAWHDIIREKHISDVIAVRGETISLGDGARINLLAPFRSFAGASPGNVHDAMVVMKLSYASSSALLMGDAEVPLEYQLIQSGDNLRADVLKVGHHGSKTSSTETFLEAVQPAAAVISAGRKNPYGHPHEAVLDRLHALGIAVFRTDKDGDLTFVSDGKSFFPERH